MKRTILILVVLAPAISRAAGGEPARVAFSSRSLASASYAKETALLEIEFRSGAVYRYRSVPEEVYTGLLGAASKGRFFQERVRGKFSFERVRKARP